VPAGLGGDAVPRLRDGATCGVQGCVEASFSWASPCLRPRASG
jgi:hypothetical protein